MRSEELYTIAEICAQLKVHERTVYRWLKAGRLKAFKAGKLWRIPASSLDAFLGETATPAPVIPGNETVTDSQSLDTQTPQPVPSDAGISPANPGVESTAAQQPETAAGQPEPAAGNAGSVEERRVVRIRYETLEGVIRYDERNPADFEVILDHPVREHVVAHFMSERDFRTPASRHDDRHIERARPVDDPSYFSLALCTLHVSTGVRVDW